MESLVSISSEDSWILDPGSFQVSENMLGCISVFSTLSCVCVPSVLLFGFLEVNRSNRGEAVEHSGGFDPKTRFFGWWPVKYQGKNITHGLSLTYNPNDCGYIKGRTSEFWCCPIFRHLGPWGNHEVCRFFLNGAARMVWIIVLAARLGPTFKQPPF